MSGSLKFELAPRFLHNEGQKSADVLVCLFTRVQIFCAPGPPANHLNDGLTGIYEMGCSLNGMPKMNAHGIHEQPLFMRSRVVSMRKYL